MSIELVRMEDGDTFECTNSFWSRLLAVAAQNGWEASGSYLVDEEGEEKEDWSGSYDEPSGQGVTEEDAEEMLAALERAIDNDIVVNSDFVESEVIIVKEFIQWGRIEEDGDFFAVGFEIN